MKRLILPTVLILATVSMAWAAPVRVACVGDSITAGMGAQPGWGYPSQLQRMLGDGYLVGNFGVSGATLLRHGNKPYEKETALARALEFKPDVMILMLGTNDTKPANWPGHGADFEQDYRWLVSQFTSANPSLKVFLCRPCWVAGGGKYGINDPVLQQEIPIIDKIAQSLGATVVDMHAALQGRPQMLADTVHPNKDGATALARTAYNALTGHDYHGPVPAPTPILVPAAAH